MADKDDYIVDGKPLSSLRVVDLKQELEKRGLSKSGTKKDLADRLKTRLGLELLQQQQQEAQKVQEESPHVPNLSLTQELGDSNDFVKSYLAQQQKTYQEQIEIKHQVMSQSAPQEEHVPSEATPSEAPKCPSQDEERRVEDEAKPAEIATTTESVTDSVECPLAKETPPQELAPAEVKTAVEEEKPAESPTVPPDVKESKINDENDGEPEVADHAAASTDDTTKDEVKSCKETDGDSIDCAANQESKNDEASKNEACVKGDESLNENVTSKTRPKRKWGGRTERSSMQGITTSELNNLLPSKEKVSRIAGQDDVTEAGSEESASIASGNLKASTDITAANTTFSGKSSGSSLDNGNDSSTVENPDVNSEKMNESTVSTAVGTGKTGSPSDVPVAEEITQKEQTPPKNPVSCYIFICNLTRPFTLKALQTLVSKFGTISSENFWIDKIKSKCIVEYDTEENSTEARKQLHGLRWPDSNPKTLTVDFSSHDELNQWKLSEQENTAATLTPTAKSSNQETRERNESKTRSVDKYDVVLRSTNEDTNENETSKRQIREWDRDKVTDEISPKRSRRSPHEKDRGVEEKKLDKEPPARLLDDLFRKTTALPVLYWLPLNEEEAEKRIKVREEREKKRKQEYEAREERLRELRERQNQSPRGRKFRSPPFRGQGNRGDQGDRRRSPRRNSRSRSRSRSPLWRPQGGPRRRSRSAGRRWSPRRK